jgi:hypothetical protein
MTHINTFYGQEAEHFNVKAGGIYRNHCIYLWLTSQNQKYGNVSELYIIISFIMLVRLCSLTDYSDMIFEAGLMDINLSTLAIFIL